MSQPFNEYKKTFIFQSCAFTNSEFICEFLIEKETFFPKRSIFLQFPMRISQVSCARLFQKNLAASQVEFPVSYRTGVFLQFGPV